MKNIKYAVAASLAVMILAGNAGVAFAQTSSTTDALLTQIQALLKQVKSLQDQMAALDAQRGQLATQLQQTMKLTRSLSLGMTSDEVKLLQEMLASDPEVYPEGLVTGYYGPLTQKAVKKFQAKMGIEAVGHVGPKTLAKINSMMLQGVGSAGKLPPGLAKKLGLGVASTTDLDDNDLALKVTVCHKPAGVNPHTLSIGAPALSAHLAHGDSVGACSTNSGGGNATSTTDVVAPVISNLASATGTTTAYVSWTTNENASSTLWYSTTTPVNTATASKVENDSFKTVHSYSLSNLTATTTYYYLIKVSDAAHNSATTTEHSFKTLDN